MNRTIRFILALLVLTSFPAFAGSESTIEARPSKDLFLRWKPSVSENEKDRLRKVWGMSVVWKSRYVKGLERVVPSHPSGTAQRTAGGLASHPSLIYAQENVRIHRRMAPGGGAMLSPRVGQRISLSLPDDPMLSQQWAIIGDAGVHAEGAWNHTHGSKSVIVAVIDTGVDATHPELSDRVLPNGYDFIDRTPKVTDHHGHGTHVSGIIGARSGNKVGIAGINPEISILPIRAVPTDGDETDANLLESFEYAAKNGARVANCSFGKAESSQAVGDVIAGTEKAGLLVIVAAGNDGRDINRVPTFPASFRSPNMIVVASHTSRGSMSSFSNFGMGKVDLSAPGSGILSSIPGGKYASWDGTSMATPQVVGVAALTLAAKPTLSPAQLRAVLLSSVEPMGSLRGKVTTGGRVDAAKAVSAALGRR